MTDYHRQDLSEVETLLATRQQLADWLEKLEAAWNKTPPSVRDRVRSDYQGRLGQVVEQIRGHSDVISSIWQGLRTQAEEFEELRNEEQETLAEAELRHMVGEYSDEEWARVERDCSGKIRGMDEEIDRLGAEIGRLGEIFGQIAPPPAPLVAQSVARRRDSEAGLRTPESAPVARDEVPAAPPVAESAPVSAAPTELPEAPRFVPRGGLKPRESGPVRVVPFPSAPAASKEPVAPPAPSVDELTFLKSMTIDPRNATGQASNVSVAAEPKTERPSQTVAKTLKCGECGALNRPTEWYCERCGAELAAV
ncbi:MAG: hypothetical protein EXR94_05810 [Gemmatimonadetes bacterium]|nr:hypothetical protein [Gemmatimonadota bacterium]